MPYQTQVILDGQQIILHRAIQESGSVLAPWEVPGTGRVMVASGSLMERLAPYHLLLELARHAHVRPGDGIVSREQLADDACPAPCPVVVFCCHGIEVANNMHSRDAVRLA